MARISPLQPRLTPRRPCMASKHVGRSRHRAAAVVLLLATTQAATAVTFTVTNADNDGPGSLRQAIVLANATPLGIASQHRIEFAIPGPGPHTIVLTSALPALNRRTEIDGYSQPGAQPNTASDGWNGVLMIEIDGASGPSGATDGLNLRADGSSVRGLVVNGFNTALRLGESAPPDSFQVHEVLLAGNVLGAAPDGSIRRNNTTGVRISAGSTGNRIGGSDPSERNLICAATMGSTGIVLIDASTRDNQVIDNQLGTETLICQGRGVTIQAARGNRISGNRIVHHRGGILVRSAAFENRLTSNELYAPGTGLAIDLVAPGGPSQGDGVTPNDSDDADDGGNRLQNFPVLLSAEIDPPKSANGRAGGLLVRGRLDIPPGPPRPYMIELFANAACDAGGHGPGEIHLGAFERELSDPGGVEPDGEAFTIGLAETVPASTWLTSTATDPDGNTSELSACIEVFIDPIFADGFEPVLAP